MDEEEGEMGEESGEKPMVLLPIEESISLLRKTPPLFLYKRMGDIGCAMIANVAATKLRLWLPRLDGILFLRFAILFLDTRQIYKIRRKIGANLRDSSFAISSFSISSFTISSFTISSFTMNLWFQSWVLQHIGCMSGGFETFKWCHVHAWKK